MARRWYESKSAGTALQIFEDASLFTQVDDTDRVNAVAAIRALSDNVRTAIALDCGFPNLQAYDDELEEEEYELRDRLDYYSYENRNENLNVRDGAWFIPEAVESFPGELVGFEAALMIDGDNVSQWRYTPPLPTDRLEWVLRLRSYPKKITKIRFRHGGPGNIAEQLIDVNVSAAKALSQIDEASNIIVSGIIPNWLAGSWVEIVFPTPKINARYIKINCNTNSLVNEIRVREINVRVETKLKMEAE